MTEEEAFRPLYPWMTDAQWTVASNIADVFGGMHHMRSPKPFGHGVAFTMSRSLATFDMDHLTRLVIMAHKKAIRIEISTAGMHLRVAGHMRVHDPAARCFERHPTWLDIADREALSNDH